jgi:hypothetical protein
VFLKILFLWKSLNGHGLALKRKIIITEKIKVNKDMTTNPPMLRNDMSISKHLELTLLLLRNMLQKASILFIFPGFITALAV